MSQNCIASLFELKATAIAAAGELLQLTKHEETKLLQAQVLAELIASEEHPSFMLPVLEHAVFNDVAVRKCLTPDEVKLKLSMVAQELLFVAQSKDAANHEAIIRVRNFCLLLAQFAELEMSFKVEPHKLW
jgi:hypothetical protein